MENQSRYWWFGIVVMVVTLMAQTVWADDEKVRIALVEIPGGGSDRVLEAVNGIEGVEAMPPSWFVQQVRGRAFQPDGIADRPGDLVWVLRGGNVSILMDFRPDGEEYLVRLITPEEGLPVHQFHIDRGDEGPSRGGVRLVVAELERYLGVTVVASEPPPQQEVTPQTERAQREAQAEDPEEIRRRAAEERSALAERLSSDFLWVRLHGRMFHRNFTAAGVNAVSSFNSAAFFGFELDVEAFPFVLGNPDMVEPGVYLTYNHGFDGLLLTDISQDPPTEERRSINNISVEGGMIYRLDSPLEDSMRQLRFKIGGRYETFSIGERILSNDLVLTNTAFVSLVIGTRLVLPVELLEGFAVTAAVDLVPFSTFTTDAEVYGTNSFTYGFGSEMGFVFRVSDALFLSAGYTFRILRSNFEGEGLDGIFGNSEVYEMNQGLRAGIVYQY